MEVTVDAGHQQLPDGCFVAVRFGGVQKQARCGTNQAFRFPNARRYGEITVFQRIGKCDLVWDTEIPENRRCVTVKGADDALIQLNVSLNRLEQESPQEFAPIDPVCQEMTRSSTKARQEATTYLQRHNVEAALAGAVRDLLRTMPENPLEFISKNLASRASSRSEATPSFPSVPSPPSTSTQYAEIQTSEESISCRWHLAPSVGSWLRRPTAPRIDEQSSVREKVGQKRVFHADGILRRQLLETLERGELAAPQDCREPVRRCLESALESGMLHEVLQQHEIEECREAVRQSLECSLESGLLQKSLLQNNDHQECWEAVRKDLESALESGLLHEVLLQHES